MEWGHLSWRAGRAAAAVVLSLSAPWVAGCQSPRSPVNPLDATSQPSSATDPSSASGEGSGVSQIEDPRIEESSGLALSHVHPGVLYTHNDRGAPPYLYAVDTSGTRAVLDLNVSALDWEDVASTPDGRVWIGDIGDNEEVRSSVSVSVIDEPDLLVSGAVGATTFRLRYPDGPHNAEALLVDPRGQRVYIVTKADPGRIYAAPVDLDEQRVNVLVDLGEAPPNVSAGDFADDGGTVVLRNQAQAYFFRRLGGPATRVSLPEQPQGESVTFTPSGTQVLLGSEDRKSVV